MSEQYKFRSSRRSFRRCSRLPTSSLCFKPKPVVVYNLANLLRKTNSGWSSWFMASDCNRSWYPRVGRSIRPLEIFLLLAYRHRQIGSKKRLGSFYDSLMFIFCLYVASKFNVGRYSIAIYASQSATAVASDITELPFKSSGNYQTPILLASTFSPCFLP